MNIVTGYRGEPHITAWQWRDLNAGIIGEATYILEVGGNLEPTIVTNNQVRIADGALSMQGCLGVIQAGTIQTLTIENGSQGMQRRDLICAQYTKNGSTGVEDIDLVVVKGTPASSNPSDPSYTSGDIRTGSTIVQVPVYRVNINGINISSVETLVPVVLPTASLTTGISAHESQISEIDTAISELQGDVSSILSKISGFIVTASKSKTYSIGEHDSTPVDISCSKSGYTLLGVVGFATGRYNIHCYGISISGNTVTMSLYNDGSASNDRTARVLALYVKN